MQTVRFKNELERNITIKLGYANAKIYKRAEEEPGPGNFRSKGSKTPDEFTDDGKTWRLVRHVSFVDCPGHDILMATMLNGAAVMDAALLLVAGNEPCPQPQTSEHLAAVEIMRLENIIILQNKVDLVKPDAALAQHEQIKKFVAGTVAGDAPIIPISAVLKYNVDAVCESPRPRRNHPITDYPRRGRGAAATTAGVRGIPSRTIRVAAAAPPRPPREFEASHHGLSASRPRRLSNTSS